MERADDQDNEDSAQHENHGSRVVFIRYVLQIVVRAGNAADGNLGILNFVSFTARSTAD